MPYYMGGTVALRLRILVKTVLVDVLILDKTFETRAPRGFSCFEVPRLSCATESSASMLPPHTLTRFALLLSRESCTVGVLCSDSFSCVDNSEQNGI